MRGGSEHARVPVRMDDVHHGSVGRRESQVKVLDLKTGSSRVQTWRERPGSEWLRNVHFPTNYCNTRELTNQNVIARANFILVFLFQRRGKVFPSFLLNC